MANHNLVFDEEMDESFALIAIHCSEEEYKVAYLLNVHLDTRLVRRTPDLDFTMGGKSVPFPIYDFEDGLSYNSYHLIGNKGRIETSSLHPSNGLFGFEVSEKSQIHHLFPEFKNVDYFLKIYSDFDMIPLQKIISEINAIKQVISAYSVELQNIKSKNNLIFD